MGSIRAAVDPVGTALGSRVRAAPVLPGGQQAAGVAVGAVVLTSWAVDDVDFFCHLNGSCGHLSLLDLWSEHERDHDAVAGVACAGFQVAGGVGWATVQPVAAAHGVRLGTAAELARGGPFTAGFGATAQA